MFFFEKKNQKTFAIVLTRHIATMCVNGILKDCIFRIVTWLAFTVTLTRLWTIVLSTPVIGFGNNFDFIRQSSCVGLWEDYGDRPKTQPHPDGPVPRLVFDGDRQKYLCMRSIDNVFPYLAAHRHESNDHVDIREIGFWKALIAAVAFLILICQALPAFANCFIAVAVALTLGDLDTLSYLNTMYLEFSVAFAGIFALAAGSALLGRVSAPGWGQVSIVAIPLVWLALSKQQYGGLAMGIAAILAWILHTRWRRSGLAFLLLAATAGATVLFGQLNSTPWGLVGAADKANRTDTFLGAVLPAAPDRAQALLTLGLPASCLSSVGDTWYTPGLQNNYPCPAILSLSRWRLVPLFFGQPATLSVPMAHGISLSQTPASNEPARWEHPGDALLPWSVFLTMASPSHLAAILPAKFYRVTVLLLSAGGWIALLLLLWHAKRRREGTGYGLAMAGLGGFTALYTIASTVFGDGYQDVHRHAVLLPAGLVFVALGAICYLYETYARSRVAPGAQGLRA